MLNKKKMLFVPMILVLCLVVSLLAGVVAYGDYASRVYTYGVAVSGDYIFMPDPGQTVSNYWLQSGSLPNGMYLSGDRSGVVIMGTPCATGNYSPRVIIDTNTGRTTVDVAITVSGGSNPQPAPVYGPPVLTKSPTGETVQAGGAALFVARANNYKGIAWYLVRSDYGAYIPMESIGSYFEGAWASNYYTEKLTVGGIPKSMNGWMVQCYFNNPYGEVWSGAAPITVTNPAPKPTPTPAPTPVSAKQPVITTQPKVVTSEVGQNATLSVAANSPDSGSLSYQWYSSITGDIHTMSPIVAAESSTLVLPQTEGTKYYCCIVTNSKNNTSAYLVSDIVTATLTAPAVMPDPTPAPAAAQQIAAPTPAPATATAPAPAAAAAAEVTPAAAVAPAAPAAQTTQSAVMTYALYGVIGFLAVLVVVLLMALSKRSKHEHER